MKHGSLFSGIGGFDLAAEWMGWENVFHCEIEAFPRKVLNYYWPNSISYEDIKTTDFSVHRGKIDIITGGFPCQPYSTAGNRLGKNDERHLWPEMLRAIQSIQPRWIVGENVRGLVSWSDGLVFEEVQTDLETEGYEVQAFLLPAAGVNAPHKRERIWFVAKNTDSSGFVQRKSEEKGTEIWGQRDIGSGDSERIHRKKGTNASDTSKQRCDNGCDNREKRHVQNNINGDASQSESERNRRKCGACEVGEIGNAPNTNSNRLQGGLSSDKFGESSGKEEPIKERLSIYGGRVSFEEFPTQSPICGGDDVLSIELDGITFPKWRLESVKGYGNAVVPQLVFQIFKTIEDYEALNT